MESTPTSSHGASSSPELPTQARVVVIGGGIIGSSTAYHLAALGWTDVVVLERAKFTSGSTFHAAGLVGQLRSSANITQLLKDSVELYEALEAETGQATGWRQNGGLRLACNAERWTEVKRQATTAHSFGLEMELLTPKEAGDLWPLMDTRDLVGAAFLPTDGQASPSDLCSALVKGARQRGVTMIEDSPVTRVLVENGRACGVVTERGTIRCEVVVNCAGMWARNLAAAIGVNVPLQAMRHQFMVSEPVEGVTPDLPTLRDPDRLVYFKEEVNGLVLGGYEPNPVPWVRQIPDPWTFQLIEPDWEQFEQIALQGMERVPALRDVGARKLVNGPEAFTPDGNFILGEAPEVAGFFVGAGFNAFGIASAGGAGKALAQWIVGGEMPMDLWAVDIRRFGPHTADDDFNERRTTEATAHHYAMSWPHEEWTSARGVRTSPLYDLLEANGASFGEKLGWERPNWFAPEGEDPIDEHTYGRSNWFPHVGSEHQAARERVVLFDQTSFAKFSVTGPDATEALSWICAGDVHKPVGSLIYTQLLNARGGIESDLTVARVDDDAFYIVTGTGYAIHDLHWIRRNIPDGLDVEVTDVTREHAVLGVQGPRARDVLSQLTDAPLTNDAFPFLTTQRIDVAGVPVRASRLTFVGELGWELHIPVDQARTVYAALKTAGEAHGMADAGYRAIESLRLEKGYRIWGKDITSDNSPIEAGLAFATKLRTDIPFLGRDALLRQKDSGMPTRRLATFTVADPDVILHGRETIYRDGERVGYLTSGGWGYTVERNIGMGYVRVDPPISRRELLASDYALEVATELVPCQVTLSPLHDPERRNVLA
ncbi:MAG: FAD-dependent oxidoreductase [Planctomycetota bacterium]|nr:FAD-dependent oxidoreductase [Planctomycetota bacterium]